MSREEREQQKRARERSAAWHKFIDERGQRYAACRLSNFDTSDPDQRAASRKLAALQAVQSYCESIIDRVTLGHGLLLYGPRGTGKDHLLAAAVRVAIGADLQVKWRNGMDLFGDSRDLFDSRRSEKNFILDLVTPDVLCISDPLPPDGKLTEHQSATLFRILDGRYSRKKPTWVTVNVSTAAELESRMGAQNADRLKDGALAVHCSWSSYRRRLPGSIVHSVSP